jgi:sugar O-acyltransferase (sialic acid O-acetyltransferase NeuD family)
VSDKKVILIGYSGHGYVVAETALENSMIFMGYADKNKLIQNPFNLKYLGFENDDDFVGWSANVSFVLGIGDNSIRDKIANLIERKNKTLQTVIHNSAAISKTAIIENGTFVGKMVAVNSFACIGKNVILNTGCIVEHECVISSSVHVAPGAVLTGSVHVGERTFIGANSVVKQGIVIGSDVIIGAGSVIINDIPNGKKVVGNPARII